MPLTVDQFVRRLVAAGLFNRTEMNDVVDGLNPPPQDGEVLAKELVTQGKLTRLQAQRVYAGEGKSLVLGNYLILDKIGAGGMGEVYRARHRRLGREVALKVLPADVTNNERAVRRFHREVQAVAKLAHPNIVAAFDADEDNGTHYLVMEYVDGADLNSTVKRDGPLPVETAIRCVRQTALGLDYAHRQGIVHRDIKPANLLLVDGRKSKDNGPEIDSQLSTLDSQLFVKILDLGLARFESGTGNAASQTELTQTGAVMGTVDYMAPEQAVNTKNADARSDVYSLGCTLWYLLTGRPVFTGETVIEKILAHRDSPIPSLVDAVTQKSRPPQEAALPAVNAVFQKMVAKKSEDRFQTMAEVARALQRCLAAAPVAAPTTADTDGTDLELRRFLQGMDEPQTIALDEPQPVPAVSPAETSKSDVFEETLSLGLTKNPRKTLRDHLGSRHVQLCGGAGVAVLAAVILIATFSGGEKQKDKQHDKKPKPDNNPIAAASKPPPLAALPFDEKQAKAHQQAWAKHLGVPVETVNKLGMTFRLVPAGEFEMGASAGEVTPLLGKPEFIDSNLRSEFPKRRVRITRPFYLGVHEVTQLQMQQVLSNDAGFRPSFFSAAGGGRDRVKGRDTSKLPAELVDGLAAAKFCDELSSREGLKPYYVFFDKKVVVTGSDGYRLPTEEEWEFACRAGSTAAYAAGDRPDDLDERAWHFGNSEERTHAVGGKRPNAFGLYDMHGNVGERCLLRDSDWTVENRDAVRTIGVPLRNVLSVVRGGHVGGRPHQQRCAVRQITGFGYAAGLRVARTINPKAGGPPQVLDRNPPPGKLPPSPYSKRPKPARTIPVAGGFATAQDAPRVLAIIGLRGGLAAVVYDLHTAKEVARWLLTPWVNNQNEVWRAFSPDGKLAVFHFQSGEVWIWHVDKPDQPLKVREWSGNALPAVSFDSRTVALRHDRTTIAIRDADTGKPRGFLKNADGNTGPMVFSPDGRWLWTSGGAGIYRWDLQNLNKPGQIIAGTEGALRMGVSSDGAYVAGGWRDFRVLSVQQGKVTGTLKPHGGAFGTPVLSRDAEGRHVLAAMSAVGDAFSGRRLFLELWDLDSGTRRMLVPFEDGQDWGVLGFVREKDGRLRLVVAQRYATQIEFWDIPPHPGDIGGNAGEKGNHALAFDGKDDYVYIPEIQYEKNRPITLEARVKLS
ncbi:MAG: protein kinase, partial [Planctomycetaceae bacterium]